MKLGIVSRISEFPEKYWPAEFELAGKKKLDHMELIVNYPYFAPITYIKEQVEKINNWAKDYDLEIILHLLPNQYGLAPEQVKEMFSSSYGIKKFIEHEGKLKNQFFNAAALDEGIRKFSIGEIRRTYELGKKINAKLITIHGGAFKDFRDYGRNLGASRKTLEELNDYFKDIKLCVENMPIKGHFGNLTKELPIEASDMLYLVNGLDNVGITLDIAHANNVENAVEFYDKIKSCGKIWDMHIHDNDGKLDDHLPLGKGNVDFKKFLDKLRQDDYKGYFSIELDTFNEENMEQNERIDGLEYLRNLGMRSNKE